MMVAGGSPAPLTGYLGGSRTVVNQKSEIARIVAM
jgi:hypothetical protein